MSLEGDIYKLFSNIDGPLFKQQRLDLLNAINIIANDIASTSQKYELGIVESLEGLQNLLDAVADIAHDYYNIDCLMTEDENA